MDHNMYNGIHYVHYLSLFNNDIVFPKYIMKRR